MPMTLEEIELSRKFLNAQGRIIQVEEDRNRLLLAVASLVHRVRKLETVVEGMAIGKGR